MSPMGMAMPVSTNTTPDGKLLFSWGEPGTDPGEFNIVHNICCDEDGWVYVADRENHRIQVFDGDGQVRDALAQYASAVRAVHDAREESRLRILARAGPAWR